MAIDKNEGYWVLLDDDEPSPSSEGYWVLQEDEVPEDSTAKYVARTALQAPLGAASLVTYPGDIMSAAAQGATLGAFEESDAMEEARRLFPDEFHPQIPREEQALYAEEVGRYMPTQSNLERVLEETTGLPLQARDELQKMLRLGGEAAALRPGGIKSKLFAGAAAPTVSQAAQAMGANEGIANVAGLLAAGAPIPRLEKGPKEIVKMPSGLTERRIVTAKKSRIPFLAASDQKAVIKAMDEEAAGIAKNILKREKPIITQIEEGFDFDKAFKQEFGEVKQFAAKYNPQIDTKPISRFMSKEFAETVNIPAPSSTIKKIQSEIKAFRKKPLNSLYDSFKKFRDINRKISAMKKKAYSEGVDPDAEYLKFLDDYKRSIVNSWEETLPKDSPWLKKFKQSNKNFSDYMSAEAANHKLKGFFGEEIDPEYLKKITSNRHFQNKLKESLGEAGVSDLVELSKDLLASKNALKKIPSESLSKFSKELSYYEKILEKLPILKVTRLPREMLAIYLTKPKVKQQMKVVFDAIEKNDPKAFGVAIKELSKILKSEED